MSESILLAIMGGNLLTANEAILAIYHALHGVNAGTLDGADLDAAIYAAVDGLPDDMRPEDLPPRKVVRKSKKRFEDML